MEICDDEQECCGSGCTNCVLDLKPVNHKLPAGVSNLFDRTYQKFVCSSIAQETGNVFRFRLRFEKFSSNRSDAELHRLIVPPGCHLFLRAPKKRIRTEWPAHDALAAWHERNLAHSHHRTPQSKVIEKYDKNEEDLYFSRPYTPISFDKEEGTFDVLIKMEPGGTMTEYLLTLSVGSPTEWKGVYGDFQWNRNRYQNVVGFVQGVAIAPVYSTMKAILDDEADFTRVTLCACFRDLQNVLLRDELLSMAGYWNFKYATYLARRSCSCLEETALCGCIRSQIKYKEAIHNRRLEAKDIEHLLQPFSEKPNSLLVLLCGTESFTMFIKTSLAKLRIENCYTF